MLQHNPKLESFTLHLLAVLFLFSAFSTVFLSYSIIQTEQDNFPSTSSPVYAAYTDYDWAQNSWNGGVSSNAYTINWGATGGWTNYSSASGVSFGSTGFTMDIGGVLTSSIINTGSKRVVIFIPETASSIDPLLEVRLGNSQTEVSNAAWSSVSTFCSWVNYTYLQYRIENNTGSSILIDRVSTWAMVLEPLGQVKDASTGNILSGVTIDYGSGTTTSNDSSFYNFTFFADFIPGTTLNITASKAGYSSQTTSITLPTDACTGDTYLNFSLTPVSSQSATNPPPTSQSIQSTSKTTTTQGPSLSVGEFQQVTLPALFTAPGSTTTDLTKVADPSSVNNFTLDIPGESKIVFKEPVNLSGSTTVDYLKTLDKFVTMDSGTVRFDSQILTNLNKPATITMYGLGYVSTPEILVDGKPDTSGVVSNVVFDKQTGILSFDVAHFTSFQAVPKLAIILPTREIRDANTSIRGRISDPKATVTGTFNGVKLAKIKPNEITGEFLISNLVFKQGNNSLKLEAKSSLGKVLPLNEVIKFGNAAASNAQTFKQTHVLLLALVMLVLVLLLGYFIYRKRLGIGTNH